jgi:hypothetical protein
MSIRRTKRVGRLNGRTEIGATVNDVRSGYEAFCLRHGLPLPGKWSPKRMASRGKASREAAKEAKG